MWIVAAVWLACIAGAQSANVWTQSNPMEGVQFSRCVASVYGCIYHMSFYFLLLTNHSLIDHTPAFSEFAVFARVGPSDVIIYGGMSTAYAALGDTWRFSLDWNVWQLVSVARAPAPRTLAAFASVNATHVLVYGGITGL